MCRKAPTWPNRATLECPDPFSKQSNPLFRIFFTLAGGSSGMHIWTKVTSLSVSARTGNRFEFKFTNSRKRWGGRFEYQPNPPQGAPLAGFRAYPHTKPPLLLAASYSCMSGCLGGCCGPKEVHGGHHPTLGGTGDIQGDGWWPRGALGGPQWSGKAYFALFADLLPAFVPSHKQDSEWRRRTRSRTPLVILACHIGFCMYVKHEGEAK